jgi:hypothetical protein
MLRWIGLRLPYAAGARGGDVAAKRSPPRPAARRVEAPVEVEPAKAKPAMRRVKERRAREPAFAPAGPAAADVAAAEVAAARALAERLASNGEAEASSSDDAGENEAAHAAAPEEPLSRDEAAAVLAAAAADVAAVTATAPAAAPPPAAAAPAPATELIFRLERRGEGWGEEIIPHLTVERRPVAPPARRGRARRLAAPGAAADGGAGVREWEEGAEGALGADGADADGGAAADTRLEDYLSGLGVPREEVAGLVATAVAWRVTPGGRPLIDRRRQSRLTRNVRQVAEYLAAGCGVPADDAGGVAAVFRAVPELMLCKPSSNDRWDRRAVELAAFRHARGHCAVPDGWPPNPELAAWVRRQRVARAAGQLNEERLRILERIGFDFGGLAQVTEEWEARFDQLVDWLLWHAERGERVSWVGADWGARGGGTARELALWVALQREFRRRGVLPAEAEARLGAMGAEWEPADGPAEARRWVGWLGRLLYVAERRRASTRPPRLSYAAAAQQARREARDAAAARDDGDEEEEDEDEEEGGGAARRRAAAARAAALAAAPVTEEPGLRFWLARQRALWRAGALPAERVAMLHLAGAEMDATPPAAWQAAAHEAAEALTGARIALPPGGAPPAPPPRGSPRLRVRRWVRAQRALFAAGRLSAAQLRYLAFLGASWALADEVVLEGEGPWRARAAALAAMRAAAVPPPPELAEWLGRQRGLRAAGLLAPRRAAALEAARAGWAHARLADAAEWDARLAQLLAHNVARGGALAASAPAPAAPLGLLEWVAAQQAAAAAGDLDGGRLAQLRALGAAPPAPLRPAAVRAG